MGKKRKRGQLFEIMDGEHKGKRCIIYYDDQTVELKEQGKVAVLILDEAKITDNQDLIASNTKLMRVGFFD